MESIRKEVTQFGMPGIHDLANADVLPDRGHRLWAVLAEPGLCRIPSEVAPDLLLQNRDQLRLHEAIVVWNANANAPGPGAELALEWPASPKAVIQPAARGGPQPDLPDEIVRDEARATADIMGPAWQLATMALARRNFQMKTWLPLIALALCATCVRAAEGTQERIDSIWATVQTAFVAKRFESINDLAGQMQRQRSRLPDGRWELPFVTSALEWNLPSHDNGAWQARLAQVDEWIARTPQDSTPYLAKATLLTAYAWDARGGGWASTVDEDGWRLFKDRLVAARKVLESSSAISKTSPVWYETMQSVALGLSWPEPAYSSLFNEAVQREPTYYFYYFNAAQYFLPRWQGRPGDLAQFVDRAVDRTQGKEGQTLYARIYWSLLWAFKAQTFSPDRANWPRMRQGFQDILRSYPDNWNANAFAFYACMAEDWPTYLQATKRVTHPEARMWMFGLDMSSCSQRAGKPGSPR